VRGSALERAEETLRQQRLLQPGAASSSPLAAQGSVYPVCTLVHLGYSEAVIVYRAVLGLGGNEVTGQLPADCFLAIWLSNSVKE